MAKPLLLLSLLLIATPALRAETLLIAAPSSMHQPLRAIAENFSHKTGIPAKLLFGATGKHYAQILHGAPIQIFIAANPLYPEQLQRQKRITKEDRYSFARGRLALWNPTPPAHRDHAAELSQPELGILAMANPDLAPYGQAAREVLQGLGLWGGRLQIATGENVAQAYGFVHSGAAPRGFVALAQLLGRLPESLDQYWVVPETLHTPLIHEAVRLESSASAEEFILELYAPGARKTLRQHGYRPLTP